MEKIYLKLYIGMVLSALFTLAGFNYVVDPFYLFSSPRIKNFNYFKPAADTRMRLSKAYLVRKLKPKTVLIGSSRALALKQDHRLFKHKPVMNYALASSTSYELYRYLQHAHYHAPLKQIIYGLDYFTFKNTPHEQFYKEHRLSINENGTPASKQISNYLKDVIPGLFTISALKSSLKTIKQQHKGDLGHTQSIQSRIESVIRNGGHQTLFLNLEKDTLAITKVQKKIRNCPTTPARLINHEDFSSFRKILRFAYKNNIDMKMYISPQHARLLEIHYLTGTWRTIEQWKRIITTINEAEAKNAKKAPFPIWDFSGFNQYTTEAVPTKKASLMKWYWEDTHFTSELGDIILDTILNDNPEQKENPSFGKFLNSKTIEEVLVSICKERDTHLHKDPLFFQNIKNIVTQYVK